VKKSRRSSAGSSSRSRALAALALSILACAPRPSGDLVRGDAACAQLDTFYAQTFPRPIEMRGRATFDVESYRVRGHFELRSFANGDAVLEFGGTTLLGGQREDVLVSLSGDTLRLLDRERGRFYEGSEVEALMADATHATGAWVVALRRILVSGCPGVEAIGLTEEGVSGSADGGTFELQAPAGRLETATWPNPAPEETFRDRLEVRYRWKGARLQEIEARLPTRGWRVRLEAD
jgi:hypothetical protein